MNKPILDSQLEVILTTPDPPEEIISADGNVTTVVHNSNEGKSQTINANN
jgi:hypothetical protein